MGPQGKHPLMVLHSLLCREESLVGGLKKLLLLVNEVLEMRGGDSRSIEMDREGLEDAFGELLEEKQVMREINVQEV